MSQEKEEKADLPRVLPVVRLAGTTYFVDLEQRQFRETLNPKCYVDIDSADGKRMCRQAGVGTCLKCGMIDYDSGGFEHAAILTDLDGDGVEELYVASDKHGEIRRYVWNKGKPVREVIHSHGEEFNGFTWNLMPIPVELIP